MGLAGWNWDLACLDPILFSLTNLEGQVRECSLDDLDRDGIGMGGHQPS
jgi:hypothetical protein